MCIHSVPSAFLEGSIGWTPGFLVLDTFLATRCRDPDYVPTPSCKQHQFVSKQVLRWWHTRSKNVAGCFLSPVFMDLVLLAIRFEEIRFIIHNWRNRNSSWWRIQTFGPDFKLARGLTELASCNWYDTVAKLNRITQSLSMFWRNELVVVEDFRFSKAFWAPTGLVWK